MSSTEINASDIDKLSITMPLSSASQENSNGHDHEMATNGAEEIDESLYSRQLYVLGADAMKKMSMSR